jgi:hypothetical protein
MDKVLSDDLQKILFATESYCIVNQLSPLQTYNHFRLVVKNNLTSDQRIELKLFLHSPNQEI